MSGFKTHLLIGAVGGYALTHALAPQLAGLAPPIPGIPGGGAGVALIMGSAVLADWPDIDEPGSWVSRHVRKAVTVVALALGAVAGWLSTSRLPGAISPWVGAAVGLVVGGALGPPLGWLLLRLIRRGAGGHRRLTHSLVLSVPAALGAALLWDAGSHQAAGVLAALAWGQWLHLVGDLVTVSGVPVLYPLSRRDLRILPQPLCRIGEPIIVVVALAVAALLLGSY